MLTLDDPLVRYRYGGREKLAEEGRCRMCLRPKRIRRLTRHHLVPQRWFNSRARTSPGPQHPDFVRLGIAPFEEFRVRDCDANVVPLCAPCHNEVETDVSARKTLRKLLGATEVAFAIKLLGEQWFDSTYPPSHRPTHAAVAA